MSKLCCVLNIERHLMLRISAVDIRLRCVMKQWSGALILDMETECKYCSVVNGMYCVRQELQTWQRYEL